MKDINEVIKDVSVPYISERDSTESIILQFIEYVKEIERRRGLTEDQIIAKYSHGCCEQLQRGILDVARAFGKHCINRRISNCQMTKLENLSNGGSHYVVETYPEDMSTDEFLSEKGSKNVRFFDITGKHNADWPLKFANEFYIKNEKYIHIKRAMTEEQIAEDDNIPGFYAARTIIEKNRDKDRYTKIQDLITQMGWYHKGQSTLSILDFKKMCIELGVNCDELMEYAKEKASFRDDIDKLNQTELQSIVERMPQIEKTEIRKEVN